ncbi:MAG TPA: hypothetical protein VIO94_05900, partial [Phenylobacterium sp.]
VLRPPRSPQSCIEGLPVDEGRDVLRQIWALAQTTPHAVEVRLDPGVLVIWEGIAASHTNPAQARDVARMSWFATAPAVELSAEPL